MKKSFLSLAFFSMMAIAADNESIECTKLLQLMRQAVELDTRLVEVTGDIEQREKDFSATWAKMTETERENAEKMCAETAAELAEAIQNFQSPK